MHIFIVDTTGTQPYIFGSNRLRENIAASYLVAHVLGKLALQHVPMPNNVHDVKTGHLDPDQYLEENTGATEGDKLRAEVLYAGGGNVVVLFGDVADARQFERSLTENALEQAPGLQLATAGVDFDWNGAQSLAEAMGQLLHTLFETKKSRIRSAPVLGLSVTVMCQSTGLPATGMTEAIAGDPRSRYPASPEILAKHEVYTEAKKRLDDMLALPDGFRYPDEFDHLGRTEGSMSYLAVVHADGNGMGQRVNMVREAYAKPNQNRDYIGALRDFSVGVEEASIRAQKHVINKLCSAVDLSEGTIAHSVRIGDRQEQGARQLNQIKLKRAPDGEGWYLPFRPLVFGGDDLTFVCDGRLGLSLATEYVKQFEIETRKQFENQHEPWAAAITACAGVAIVKTHYPFSRAYSLAEELTQNAKTFRRQTRDENPNWDGACIDWHFAQGGLAGSIELIREREYTTANGHLNLRPVVLNEYPGAGKKARSWLSVKEGIEEFQSPDWITRRNKVKRLRDALRDGPAVVEQFKDAHGSLPELSTVNGQVQSCGWSGRRCAYFDSLELSDLHMPLP